jgi:hypothetical protein
LPNRYPAASGACRSAPHRSLTAPARAQPTVDEWLAVAILEDAFLGRKLRKSGVRRASAAGEHAFFGDMLPVTMEPAPSLGQPPVIVVPSARESVLSL